MPYIFSDGNEPFQYNPAITNINIDNQLAGILSQFNTDYIMEYIDDAINKRLRLYDTLNLPNIVYGYEVRFRQLTDGFSSNVEEISAVRQSVYYTIINKICTFFNLSPTFDGSSDIDWYSAAFWLYKFLVSEFTMNIINFYSFFIVTERVGICDNLGLNGLRRENDVTYSYSKRLFQDPKLAAIHSNIQMVLASMGTFDISIDTIVRHLYQTPNMDVANYISSLVTDNGNFFRTQYDAIVNDVKYNAELSTHIKMNIQKIGKNVMPIEDKKTRKRPTNIDLNTIDQNGVPIDEE